MMDSAAQAPSRLRERTQASIDNSLALHRRWDGAASGRLRAAFARALRCPARESCSKRSLTCPISSGRSSTRTHPNHARKSPSSEGIAGGMANIEYLASLDLASPRLCAAHCVWVGERQQALLAEHDVKVMHCPGSNLKLGSGIAPVAEMRARGITVSLGADGAACNNRLDMFEEMRLAAVLQALRHRPGGPSGGWRPIAASSPRSWPRSSPPRSGTISRCRPRSSSAGRSTSGPPASGKISARARALGSRPGRKSSARHCRNR